MIPDPLREACWRFEQISPLLDPGLTGSERRRAIQAMGRTWVRWPSGREAPISPSTLYRWLRAYQNDPRIESLMPAPRPQTGAQTIDAEWVQFALALLEEEPRRSLFVLCLRIQHRFGLDRPPARSSLHRLLKKEPRYRRLRRRAGRSSRLRRRFQAGFPHQIWHADAKAAFTVRFLDGATRKLRILSILDDATRFVLAALVVETESLASAVATFRRAAARWGLPAKFYADRGSAYDADAFRKGLAVLGVHRINTRSHNAPAHGKIEAYHRRLKDWFLTELRHQPVRDPIHLQALLDAVIDRLYHEHVHRELKQTPRQALAETISSRRVSLPRLQEAFLIEKTLKAHRMTGEVRLAGKLFLVPKSFLENHGRRVRIAVDPQDPLRPYLVTRPGRYEPLPPAFETKAKRPPSARGEEPVGALSPLLEQYRGRSLPQARSGFGLPEIYQAFSQALGRRVPSTEAEAATVLAWLSAKGPFNPRSFDAALSRVLETLGPGRPLVQIIQALQRQIDRSRQKDQRL